MFKLVSHLTSYVSLLLFALLTTSAFPAWAAPGDLDTTFGTGGKVITQFLGSNSEAHSVTVQSDGKILVAGPSWGSTVNFSLARYNTNGSLDTSFGTEGKATTDTGSGGAIACNSVILQSDGKIVVAGGNNIDGNYNFLLMRNNTDGSLDTSFGTGGKVTTDFGSDDTAYSVTVQADGKILVAGTIWDGSNWDFGLSRYNTNGSLDTNFGTGGKVTTNFGAGIWNTGAWNAANSITVQSDGKILVAGTIWNGSNWDFALARYNTDGSLDASFGTGGKLITDFGAGDDRAYSVTVQSDSKILVVGSNNINFALARYSADGSLDASFGTNGKVTTDVGANAVGYSVTGTVQSDGKILVAGTAWNGSSNNDFALARYNTNGSLDTSFDTDGKLTTDFGAGDDRAYSVTIQSDSKILVVGQGQSGGSVNFAVVRYMGDAIADTIPPTTTASPTGGTYTSAQSVTLTCSDGTGSGCDKIYYTADGSTPTTSSSIYSTPINISATTTVKFFAKDLAGNSETVKTATYTINTGSSLAPGTIITVAGDGTYGFSGDGEQATSASLNSPDGVAVDSTGNVYIADYNNHRIRKVATNGVITTVAGNGTDGFSGDNGQATSASLNTPAGVAVDSIGNIYIADSFNNRIRKVATDGVITTVAGNGTHGFSGDGGQATSASLTWPEDVTIDSIGNIYIVDYNNSRIRKVATDGVITTVAGNGTAGFSGDGGQATSASLQYPHGVAIDSIGNIYIADTEIHRIRKVATDGVITTFAGNGTYGFSGDGGQATSASLAWPDGIAFDSSGNVYIADSSNHRIRKVATDGIITTFAGNGTAGFSGDGGQATSAMLYIPSGVAVDSTGNIYLADKNNHRIRKVQASDAAPDATAPTGSISINSGATSTNSTSSTLTLSCTDSSGCSQMQFSNDNTTWSTAEAYATSKAWTLSSGDGTKTVYVKFKDTAGNWSTATISDTIVLETSDLVGHWKLDGNGIDLSPFGNNGTIYGAVATTDRFGNANSAMSFNGDSDYINIPDSASLKPSLLTISAWIKPNTMSGYDDIVRKFYGDGYYLRILDPALYSFRIDFFAGGDSNATGTEIPVGAWSHVVATYDGIYQKIYINGILKHSISGMGTGITNVANPLTIGAGFGAAGFSNGFNGGIDDVCIYNRALSLSEIQALTNEGGWSPPSDTTAPTTTASLAGGTYTSAQSVTLTCSDGTGSGCGNIYYTTNGSTPTTSSTVYSSPISISATTTLKFFAKDLVGNSSSVQTNVYTITGGALWVWGDNYFGQLGIGTWLDELIPVRNGNISGIVATHGGFGHTLALKNDGTVWAWGFNGRPGISSFNTVDWIKGGQLGDGTTTDKNTPVQTLGITNAMKISAGAFHSVVLKNDSTVWTFGDNSVGQLGDGSTTNRTIPVQVSGLTGIIAISAGHGHTLALKNDGSVWSWGWNEWGQLGDGTTTDRYIPVQVSGLTSVISVSSGSSHSLALKSDGTVWAWGWNFEGQIGDGTNTDRSTPVQIGVSDIITITSGGASNFVIQNNGTIWEWGSDMTNPWGPDSPAQFTSATNVYSFALGRFFMLLKNDGTVWAWGNNSEGQFGDGTTNGSQIPVQAVGLPGIVALAAGNYHSLAIAPSMGADTTPPTGTISINSGAASTNSTSITLTLSCTDTGGCSQMKFSNDNTNWSTAETYATSKAWTLSSGSGTKTVYVKFKDGAGNWSTTYSDTITLSAALSAPANIEVNNPGVKGELLVSWTNPADADFSHIHIYRSTTSGSIGALVADNVTGIKYTDTGLASLTTYYYTVRAVDNAGNESTNTTQYSGKTLDSAPPAVPTNVTATDATTGGKINLSWTNPVDSDFAQIKVYRSAASGTLGSAVFIGLATSYSDIGLTNGTTYYYTVRAIDTSSNETTNTTQVSATPTAPDMTAPGIPGSVMVTDTQAGGTLALSWTNPTDSDFAYIRIYRSTANGVLGSVVLDKVTGTSTTDTGLTNNATYYYTIRSVDTSGNELTNTNQASGMPTDIQPPKSVTGLKVTLLASGQIKLDWTRSASTDVNYYNIYWDNGTGAIDYIHNNKVASVAHPATTWTSGSLTAGTAYKFAIRVEDLAQNEETNSNIMVSAVPVTDPNSGALSAYIETPQTGYKISGSRITVMAGLLTGVKTDVKEIRFQYKPANSGSWGDITPADANFPNPDTTQPWFTHWDATGLANGDYLIRAVSTSNALVTDSGPAYNTVTVDNTSPTVTEGKNIQNEPEKKQDISANTTNKTAIASGSGVTELTIPEGALSSDTKVTVTLSDPTSKNTLVPSGYGKANEFREVTLESGQTSLENNKDAVITVPYKDDDNNNIVDGTTTNVFDLKVMRYNTSTSTWEKLDSVVDTTTKTVKGKTNHFTLFGLLAPPNPTTPGWNLVAVPLQPNPSSASSVFGQTTYVYNPTTASYDTVSTIQPGIGYWINGGANLTASGTETPTTGNFSITLKKGWNMIGNPFRFKVKLSDCKVVYNSVEYTMSQAETNGYLIGTVYPYVNGAYQFVNASDGGALEPWVGYWILSDRDVTLRVPPTPAQ